jgi:protein TonB
LSSNVLAAPHVSQPSLTAQKPAVLTGLLGEEKPSNMLILLSILVALLHAWGIVWLLRAKEPEIVEAQPLLMEVSMIAMSAPKPSATPPKPTPPPPEKKPQPKKPEIKPKKIPPVVQKSPDFAPVEQTAEPKPVQETPPSSSNNTSTSKPATSSTDEQFTEANYKANYAHNPKPEYPTLAKSREWQGKVLLRVKVTATGLSDEVEVDRSSGHDILDDAAIDAVKQWRFTPARRGDTAIVSSVIVPIVFSLREE